MSLYPVDTVLPDGSKYPGMDPDSGKFTSGDAQQGLNASALPAETVNFILDNLGELVDFGNGSSNNADTDQIKKAVRNIVAPVGKLYTQYPFMPTPDVFYGGLGTWENISARAVGYGISDVNEGDPTSYISREDAGQGMDFADSDLAVDDQIASGTYNGKYIRSVESYEGVFFAVEGGNRNSFEDALQESQNKQHGHSITVGNDTVAFGKPGSYNSTPYYTGLGDTGITSGTDGGITLSGGIEAQPVNRSFRIWMRKV